MKILILDTETTDIRNGQICQLCYTILDFDNKKFTGKNFFFAVDSVSPGAEAVHKLSKEKLDLLSRGITFRYKYKEIQEDLESADAIIGHNIHFDISQLMNEYRRLGVRPRIKHSFCTMNFYTDICKIPNKVKKYSKTYKWPKLEEVMNFCNIDVSDANDLCRKLFKDNTSYHDARYDVVCTYKILSVAMSKYGLTGNQILNNI